MHAEISAEYEAEYIDMKHKYETMFPGVEVIRASDAKPEDYQDFDKIIVRWL